VVPSDWNFGYRGFDMSSLEETPYADCHHRELRLPVGLPLRGSYARSGERRLPSRRGTCSLRFSLVGWSKVG